MLPNKSDAFFQLIPVAIRLFGRPILKHTIKQFTKPKRINIARIKTASENNNITIEKAIKANNRENDIVNTGVFLADHLWKQHTSNRSTTMIVNSSNEPHNTGEIKVQLRDEDTAHVDVQATIQPIEIPSKSQLILETKFRNLPSSGMKRLYGTYNMEQEAKRSGRILVASSTNGISIDELYDKYNQKYDGGMKHIKF
jgi:hypothetical protein